MSIKVITWKWRREGYRDRYTAEHVNILYEMLKRHTTVPWEPLCITDDPTGVNVPTMKLWDNPVPNYGSLHKPNCFYRVRAFSSEFTHSLGKFIWFDLDAAIVGNVDHLLTDQAEFKIWRPDGEKMPCNGSLVLHQAGTRAYTWSFFDPTLVHNTWGFKYTTGFQGSDQAWIAYNLKPQDQFFTQKEGVFSFRSHLMPSYNLPPEARVVFFNGVHKPWDPVLRRQYRWLLEHYRA